MQCISNRVSRKEEKAKEEYDVDVKSKIQQFSHVKTEEQKIERRESSKKQQGETAQHEEVHNEEHVEKHNEEEIKAPVIEE